MDRRAYDITTRLPSTAARVRRAYLPSLQQWHITLAGSELPFLSSSYTPALRYNASRTTGAHGAKKREKKKRRKVAYCVHCCRFVVRLGGRVVLPSAVLYFQRSGSCAILDLRLINLFWRW